MSSDSPIIETVVRKTHNSTISEAEAEAIAAQAVLADEQQPLVLDHELLEAFRQLLRSDDTTE